MSNVRCGNIGICIHYQITVDPMGSIKLLSPLILILLAGYYVGSSRPRSSTRAAQDVRYYIIIVVHVHVHSRIKCMICCVTLEHVWVSEDLSLNALPVDYQYIVINNNNNTVNALVDLEVQNLLFPINVHCFNASMTL